MAPVVPVADPTALAAAAAVLRDGGAVVLPTDTVYGVGVLPGHQDLLYVLKARPDAMPIAVLVADVTQAETAAGRPLPPAARRLAERWWPGPLTLVVPMADGATVGVRCPAHEFVRSLAEEVGPLATTSANRHGEPTAATAAAAAASLVAPGPALVVDGGPCGTVASTVVDVTGTEAVVLRAGVIGADEVSSAARE